jgi:2'-5' RNA ligase
MPRLFIALDLPLSIKAELVRIQPPPVAGLRLVPSEQLHLTLHFIGEARIDPVVTALSSVVGSSLTLVIEGAGKFSLSGKPTVLWAGVRANTALSELHAALGNALAAGGFSLETRPYSPHLTLARCGNRVPADVIDEFLARHQALSLPPVPVTGFGLYSSTTVDGAPVYRLERWFPLSGP